MAALLKANCRGGYRFLEGIEPYSSGVVAEPGWEIVHALLARPLPWKEGLIAARQHLEQQGRDCHALCGVELRCPEPFSMEGFIQFNREYRALLEQWEMLVDGENPVARTNVAPTQSPPGESALFAFSYTVPGSVKRPTFVVAGGGELRGALDTSSIVRAGEDSAEAFLEKVRCVVGLMNERLSQLGNQELLTAIDVYTAHDFYHALDVVLMPNLPALSRIGVNWYPSRPPIEDIEFEMDMRGVCRELVVDLT